MTAKRDDFEVSQHRRYHQEQPQSRYSGMHTEGAQKGCTSLSQDLPQCTPGWQLEEDAPIDRKRSHGNKTSAFLLQRLNKHRVALLRGQVLGVGGRGVRHLAHTLKILQDHSNKQHQDPVWGSLETVWVNGRSTTKQLFICCKNPNHFFSPQCLAQSATANQWF